MLFQDPRSHEDHGLVGLVGDEYCHINGGRSRTTTGKVIRLLARAERMHFRVWQQPIRQADMHNGEPNSRKIDTADRAGSRRGSDIRCLFCSTMVLRGTDVQDVVTLSN